MKCFDLLELLDYLQNTTPHHECARIKAHLVECLNCHKSLRWLTLVQTTAAEDHSFDFPEEVIASIVTKFKELTATGQRTIRQYISWRDPMDKIKCFSLSILLKFLQNQEDNDECARICAHLTDGCTRCGENLELLLKISNSSYQNLSFDFPEEVIAAVVAKFKELTAIPQYIAKLVFDSGGLPQLVEARLEAKKPLIRRTLYQAEGYNIDLEFIWYNKSSGERLIGQVLSERSDAPAPGDATEPTPFKVELLQHGSIVFARYTNKNGGFRIDGLVSGTYDMKISVPEGEINLERVLTAYAL